MTEEDELELCHRAASMLSKRMQRSPATPLWSYGDLRDMAWLALNKMGERGPQDLSPKSLRLLLWRLVDEIRLEDRQYRSWSTRTGLKEPIGLATDFQEWSLTETYDVLDPDGLRALAEAVESATRSLAERERSIARMRYLEHMTLWRIAAQVGLHESRVSQLLSQVIKPALRAYMQRDDGLRHPSPPTTSTFLRSGACTLDHSERMGKGIFLTRRS